MSRRIRELIARFVEAEKAADRDEALLGRLREIITTEDTLYWNLTPPTRNALNAFFRDLHNTLEHELIDGKFGASIVIDSIIVVAFEAGVMAGEDGLLKQEEGS